MFFFKFKAQNANTHNFVENLFLNQKYGLLNFCLKTTYFVSDRFWFKVQTCRIWNDLNNKFEIILIFADLICTIEIVHLSGAKYIIRECALCFHYWFHSSFIIICCVWLPISPRQCGLSKQWINTNWIIPAQ